MSQTIVLLLKYSQKALVRQSSDNILKACSSSCLEFSFAAWLNSGSLSTPFVMRQNVGSKEPSPPLRHMRCWECSKWGKRPFLLESSYWTCPEAWSSLQEIASLFPCQAKPPSWIIQRFRRRSCLSRVAFNHATKDLGSMLYTLAGSAPGHIMLLPPIHIPQEPLLLCSHP